MDRADPASTAEILPGFDWETAVGRKPTGSWKRSPFSIEAFEMACS
jgi:hypothetical protein